ncbi:hypothetical protein SK803_11195 [Lentzea sp. BCCO 10_0856]|uniref:Uncharacterized protein n=1 Tax=Lentzea miocenica TaxID=3095431 RepID=A0ABU4SY00_9PSEU|nr:hypothetical protein [Lentzea sp. BCCO 10_0856]MDX8030781.1 hypothetical protein [Lentzea sp. BCCO 10_0856]
MTSQREGFLGDILDKVKDLITDDEPKKDPKPPQEDPPLTPQCCGQPPGHPLVGEPRLLSEGPVEHDLDCPNHPDNVVKEEVAS